MPLWKIYHPENAYSSVDKEGFATRIADLYPTLPRFYVGVVFQAIPKESFYIGGKPVGNFVRIWVDHIARKTPTPEARAAWVGKCDSAIAPYVRDRNFDWEFHIDETPFDLWSIQGLIPPPDKSEPFMKWLNENRASQYKLSD
jgi:phenylpyruvate tautomerase PptA (4-oxalocrotonate tautomerase family)